MCVCIIIMHGWYLIITDILFFLSSISLSCVRTCILLSLCLYISLHTIVILFVTSVLAIKENDDDQDVMELVPNIILNPGFVDSQTRFNNNAGPGAVIVASKDKYSRANGSTEPRKVWSLLLCKMVVRIKRNICRFRFYIYFCVNRSVSHVKRLMFIIHSRLPHWILRFYYYAATTSFTYFNLFIKQTHTSI